MRNGYRRIHSGGDPYGPGGWRKPGVHTFGTQQGALFSTNVSFLLAFSVFFTLVLTTWRGAGPLSLDRVLTGERDREADLYA